MNTKERIVERIHGVEMTKQEIKYPVMPLPKVVMIRTTNSKGEVEFIKQRRIRKMERMPPKHKEERKLNKIEIAKRLEKVKKDKMNNTNRILNDTNKIIIGIHKKVPIIYYIVMIFGLASAIFGAVKAISPTIDFTIMLGGLGIFLAAFIGFLEIKLSKSEFRDI